MRPGENKLHVNESTCQSKIKNNDFKCPYFKTVLIACPQGNCLWFHQETAFEGFPSNWEELAPRAHIHYWLICHISVAISHPSAPQSLFNFFFLKLWLPWTFEFTFISADFYRKWNHKWWLYTVRGEFWWREGQEITNPNRSLRSS